MFLVDIIRFISLLVTDLIKAISPDSPAIGMPVARPQPRREAITD